jgi:cysteine/glycine-rich protein
MTPSGAAIFEDKLYCSKCFEAGGFRTKQAATAAKVGGGAAAASAGPSKFGGGGNKCIKCDKTVYAAETVSFEKQAYHADCFKCGNCSKVIANASGAAVYEAQLLCTKCFKDGGYERKQANTAREYKASTSSAPSKFGGGGAKCYTCNTTVYAAEAISYEKKSFHSDCFKCKNCSKKMSPSGAEAKHLGDEIEVYCKKCWGDLGLNRAHLNAKSDGSAPAAVAAAVADDPPAASDAGASDASYAAAAEPSYEAAPEEAAPAEE